MKSNIHGGRSLLILLFVFATGHAEQYDYEISLDLGRTSFDGSQSILTPNGTVFSSTDSETDTLSAFGSWYFAGLSDDVGPRARAEFVDRASSLTFVYGHSDQETSIFQSSDDPTFPLPPLDTALDADGDSFALSVRYVDRDSGWFGNAGLLQSDLTTNGPNNAVNTSVDATGWSLGVGKYLLETTAVSLDYSEVDGDGQSDASAIAVSLTHLGNIGESWQYAIDAGYSRSDPDFGGDLDSWSAALAFYPTQDIEFGVSVVDVSGDGNTFFDPDTTTIGGFASWFVTPNVQLSARYSADDVDFAPSVVIGGSPTTSSADQDSFGISATVRF